MAHVWYVSRSLGAHDRRWISVLEGAGHDVRAFQLSTGDVSAGSLRSAGADRAPDAVVAGPLTDAAAVAVEADVAPTMGLCWGFDVLVEAAAGEAEERLCRTLAACAAVHVDCQDLAGRVVALGAEPAGVSVAAWGIDTEFFVPGAPPAGARESVGFSADDIVVLTTRSWEPLYAVDVVLRGFARARAKDPRLRLAWAGDGSMRSDLRALREDLGLSRDVRELGRLDAHALRGWLRASDVYASAARSDGSSLSLMEALACGLPAVVTDLPSNREWVRSPVHGRSFTADDPASLGDALVDVAAVSRDVAPGAAAASRRAVVLERGDWRRNRALFLQALDMMLGNRA